MNGENIRVLLIEDDLADARLLREELSELPFVRCDIRQADRLSSALELLAARPFDVVLLDLSLPDVRGLETVRRVHAGVPELPIVVLTGLDDDASALSAMKEGAQDYLLK